MDSENAAFGIFKTQKQAERAIAALERAGYDPADVALLLPQQRGHDFAYLMRNNIGTGAFIGALVGLLIGGAVGFAIAGQMYVTNSSLALILGASFGCAFGAAAGALVGIGTPRSLHNRYLEYLRDGGILLAVHDDGVERKKTAQEILEEYGASDVHKVNEADTWRNLMESASAFVRVRQGGRRILRGH